MTYLVSLGRGWPYLMRNRARPSSGLRSSCLFSESSIALLQVAITVGFKFVVLSTTWLEKHAKLSHFVSIHPLLASRTELEILEL